MREHRRAFLEWVTRLLTSEKYEIICPQCLAVRTVEISGASGRELKRIKDAIADNIHSLCGDMEREQK